MHALEVMPDHVHLFVESMPAYAPAHLAAQFKRSPRMFCGRSFRTCAAACPHSGRGRISWPRRAL
jgi:REP element-mobilizing transposase RayT